MTVVPDSCPDCGQPIESFALWDWHMKVDHGRDYEPCDYCGQWDDEPTYFGHGGWLHERCSDELASEAARAYMEGRESA
jgi:hypothetical protein